MDNTSLLQALVRYGILAASSHNLPDLVIRFGQGPEMPDDVAQEAYCQEVSSAGF